MGKLVWTCMLWKECHYTKFLGQKAAHSHSPVTDTSKWGAPTCEREEEGLEHSRLADEFREEDTATWRGSNTRLRGCTYRRQLCVCP